MSTDEQDLPDERGRPDEQEESEAQDQPALLVVVTGADHWTLDDGTEHPTGFWAEELIVPMRAFRDTGIEVTIATPGGVTPSVDVATLSAEGAVGEDRADELQTELEALADELASPVVLEDVSPEDYDGLFTPGGHGPMEDLAQSPELGALLAQMVDDDKVIAAVCHGPAALLSAQRDDGTWAFAGRELTGFANEVEDAAGLADVDSFSFHDPSQELIDVEPFGGCGRG
jgi:putative intracellular protease/amidase